jgi:hypothetical protein
MNARAVVTRRSGRNWRRSGMMKMSELLQLAGKGPGYIALAFLEVAIAGGLLSRGIDGSAIAAAFGAINLGVYGGGAFKVASEARNGGAK